MKLPSNIEHLVDLAEQTAEGSTSKISLLKKVRKAIEIKNGEEILKNNGGKCTGCGKEIPEERLKAVPGTTLCVSCTSAQEKKEKGGANK